MRVRAAADEHTARHSPGFAWQNTTTFKNQRGVVEQKLHISNNDEKADGKIENSFTAHLDQPMRWQLRKCP
jgi:hypothetical protein